MSKGKPETLLLKKTLHLFFPRNFLAESECLCGQKDLTIEVLRRGKRLCSHWSSSYITALSLVESSLVMKYFQPSVLAGQAARVSEFPWAAFLSLRSSETNQRSRCGGAVITDR